MSFHIEWYEIRLDTEVFECMHCNYPKVQITGGKLVQNTKLFYFLINFLFRDTPVAYGVPRLGVKSAAADLTPSLGTPYATGVSLKRKLIKK